MVLFVSDMHFGRADAATDREHERALVECLQAHESEVEHLYLLGDVFDGYIEYRHLVPKGFVRFQGLLARWTDRGIPVTYLLGNHDPWHRDHFSDELGVRIHPDSIHVRHCDQNLYLAHGDALGSAHSLYGWLRPLLRHPLPVRLYQTLLPADAGMSLARWVSRRLHDAEPEACAASTLRHQAFALLRQHELDAVVLGHSHIPTLEDEPVGVYGNTGNWYERRTFVRLDSGVIRLQRWNGTRAEDIEAVTL